MIALPDAGLEIPPQLPLAIANLGGRDYYFSYKQGLCAGLHETHPWVRVALMMGAKQTGKTEGAALGMIRQIYQNPGAEFLILAPSYKKLDDSTLKKFQELCDLIPGFIVPSSDKRRKRSSEQKGKLAIFNGATVFYRSADRLAGLEGMTLRACWIDEAQHIDEEIVEEIRWHRLRIKQGLLYLTAAYLRPEQWAGHYLEEYRCQAEAGDREILYVPFSCYDLQGLHDRVSGKPLFDAVEIEARRRRMPPRLFQAQILGIMESGMRDDRIFPAERIRLACERWPERFSRLPQALYEFFCQRLAERFEGAPPPRQEPSDNVDLLIISVDVAELGGDNICVTFRWGRNVYWTENWGGMKIPELERALAELYRELAAICQCLMVVDEGGLGKGIPAHLAELGVDVRGVTYNEAVSDPAYVSLKAELYFRCKDWLMDDDNPMCLPPVPALIEQMAKMKYNVSEEKKKLSVIKPKDSPDELDSLIVGIVAGDGLLNIFF